MACPTLQERKRQRSEAPRRERSSLQERKRQRSEAPRRERSSLREERKLWRKGYKSIVGLDEVGRGALAGPVVACAVLVTKNPRLAGIKDSKKLSAKKREELYSVLTTHPSIKWKVSKVSQRLIDRINILEATKLGMKRAVKKLNPDVDFLILDGKMTLGLPIPQKSIVKADEKVFSCAAASIIAKVTRDRIMKRLHKKYPQYGFDKHKGYATCLHRQVLKKYGRCDIHRNSFHYGSSQTKTHKIKKK